MRLRTTLTLCAATSSLVAAQNSNCTLRPSYAAPVVREGWEAQLVFEGLSRPRSVLFDSQGGLLVLEQKGGIKHLRLAEVNGSCVGVEREISLLEDDELNHGLALSNDSTTLYASSPDSVYAWTYDPTGPAITSKRRTLITGMQSGGHTTRTLLLSQKAPGMIVVSRGSDGNIDLGTTDISSGRSQIKAFDISNLTTDSDPYDYATQGRLLGWGLRNSVGLAEELNHGGIYSVENSADQFEREGVDISRDNPGEELNYHGFLNSSTENQGGNYGYPRCFALWDTDIPNVGEMSVGSQFSLTQNETVNDSYCASETVGPRITFQAHMAPLDIVFDGNGTEAFVSFHGSWNRNDPTGYKISSLAFNPSTGSPTESPQSKNATTDIMTNPDMSACPGACFRPVGLALDAEGRLFFSSDSTGEIWVLKRTGSGGGSGSGSASGGSGSGSEGGSPTVTETGAARPTESGSGAAGMRMGKGFEVGIGGSCWALGLCLGLLVDLRRWV